MAQRHGSLSVILCWEANRYSLIRQNDRCITYIDIINLTKIVFSPVPAECAERLNKHVEMHVNKVSRAIKRLCAHWALNLWKWYINNAGAESNTHYLGSIKFIVAAMLGGKRRHTSAMVLELDTKTMRWHELALGRFLNMACGWSQDHWSPLCMLVDLSEVFLICMLSHLLAGVWLCRSLELPRLVDLGITNAPRGLREIFEWSLPSAR